MSRPAGAPAAGEARAESYYRDLWRRLDGGGELPVWEVARWREIERLVGAVAGRVAAEDRPAPPQALDLGCGRGWITRLLADRLAGWQVHGVDPLAASVEAARARHPELDFAQATGAELLAAGEAAAYDLVVASEVIEHVPYDEHDAFLAEAYALLRPGGHLVLTTPRGEHWKRWRRDGREAQPVEDWLTEAQLAERVRRAGFAIVASSRFHPPRRPLSWQGWIDKHLLGRRWVRALPLGRLRHRLQDAAALYQGLLLRRPAVARPEGPRERRRRRGTPG